MEDGIAVHGLILGCQAGGLLQFCKDLQAVVQSAFGVEEEN